MGVESPQGMPCNHAPFGAVDHGGVRLGCGFRQPNSETEFGASVMVTPPYGSLYQQSLSRPTGDSSLYTREPLGTDCNAGSAQHRADVGIGPYG